MRIVVVKDSCGAEEIIGEETGNNDIIVLRSLVCSNQH